MLDDRDYQTEAIASGIQQLESVLSTLLLMPTGTGKTVVFSKILHEWCERYRTRALVLAHREELIRQAAKKITDVTGDGPEVEMADEVAETETLLTRSNVVVASVPTLNAGPYCKTCYQRRPDDDNAPLMPPEKCPDCLDGIRRRMQRFDPREFGLIVTDEAHHAVAPTYRRIYDFFRERNPQIRHLGVTATADRADEAAMGRIFDSVAFDYDILDAINDGWLVPITQQWVQVESIDLSDVRTTAGDLNEGELEEIMLEEETLHGVVNPTLELAGDRPTLVFATTVRHAELVADIFNRHKLHSAQCITGDTDPDKRREHLKEYARGEYQYLVGCGVFLEGFDEPRVSCVAMARPTKSRALYAQAIGRGTRPILPPTSGTADTRRSEIAASSKPDLLVLDFVGNSGKHKLISTADILGGRYEDDVIDEATQKAKSSGKAQNLLDVFREVEQEIRKRKEIKAKAARFSLVNMNPFDVFDVSPGQREPAWVKGKPPTKKQIDMLVRMGMKEQDITGFWQASKMIEAAIKRREAGLATYKQVRTLSKFGVDARGFTFETASHTLDLIARNGWRLPAGVPTGGHEVIV